MSQRGASRLSFFLHLLCGAVLLAVAPALQPLRASAPQELVELQGERFVLDLRYATPDNFLKSAVYQRFQLDRCWVTPELKTRLENLVPELQKRKLKVVLYDCFRPVEVQQAMWKLVPDPRYVADPKVGSNHNRGVAVDLALADESGKVLPYPTAFDDFTEKAAHGAPCNASNTEACKNREFLKTLMASVGIEPFATEWWHYQLSGAAQYPIARLKR